MSEASKEGLGTNDPPITRPTMETAATPGMKAQQRKVNGFPHLHAAQFTQDLLLANQFDRNMTVEKARFEAPPSTQEDDAGLSSSTDGTSVKRSTKKSTKRRARPPPAPRTASPAEVFHHNLIDAVLNVDESDENERYIYPFHNAHRFNTMPPVSYGSAGPRTNSPSSRPKLRSHVVDYRSPKELLPTPVSTKSSGRTSILSFGGSGGGGGYVTDDDEETLLLDTKHSSRQQFCNSLILNLCAGFTLFILATLLISVYRATPLTDLSINMGRVLASDKELIFDLHAHASNWNWWTVRIPEADISVFAFTQATSFDNNNNNNTAIHDPAEFLGSINRFDEPLAFYPSLLIDGPSSAISQIRIKSPGADKSGNEKWSRIIRNPYGLIVRGVFRYNTISFAKLYSQSVAICAAVDVDPITDRVSATPDQERYCSQQMEP